MEGKQVVDVTLVPDKDWKVYANPVGNELLSGTEIRLEVTAKAKPRAVRIAYPPGQRVKDDRR